MCVRARSPRCSTVRDDDGLAGRSVRLCAPQPPGVAIDDVVAHDGTLWLRAVACLYCAPPLRATGSRRREFCTGNRASDRCQILPRTATELIAHISAGESSKDACDAPIAWRGPIRLCAFRRIRAWCQRVDRLHVNDLRADLRLRHKGEREQGAAKEGGTEAV